jgi:hypothetical protein
VKHGRGIEPCRGSMRSGKLAAIRRKKLKIRQRLRCSRDKSHKVWDLWHTIILVFGFASLVVLAILLGALVVTVAVPAFLLVAGLVHRLPFVCRRSR